MKQLFKSLLEEEADVNTGLIFDEIKKKLGLPFVPELFRTHARNSQVALRASWSLISNILLKGILSRLIKEEIFVAISHELESHYCELAHLAMSKMMGLSQIERTKLVTNLKEITPERANVTICFAVKIATTPNQLNEEDLKKVRIFCQSDEELMELIAMAGVCIYADIISDAARIIPDKQFEEILNSRDKSI